MCTDVKTLLVCVTPSDAADGTRVRGFEGCFGVDSRSDKKSPHCLHNGAVAPLRSAGVHSANQPLSPPPRP